MFSLANILTAGNLMAGIFAIMLSISGHMTWAPFAIFIGAIFDFLDGFVARLTNTQGALGKQLDSLADIVTFGVAPGLMMLNYILWMESGETISIQRWLNELRHFNMDVPLLPLVALVIPFFALFRLAKFNIDESQKSSFLGLPTPAMTLFFTTFPFTLWMYPDTWGGHFLAIKNVYIIIGLIIFISVLMIMPIRLFSLKFKSLGVKGNEVRYLFLLISLGLIILFKAWSISLIVFLYLILAFLENILKSNKNEV